MKNQKALTCTIISIIVLITVISALIVYSNNFYTVTPGVLYRSKQLTDQEFYHFIKKHGIRTVINLRGKFTDARWYRSEIAVMKKYGLTHLDFKLSATDIVAPEKLDSIISLCMASPKPLLVHCKAGADRTGLFCAAWKLSVEGRPPAEALRQLSIIFGHLPLPMNPTDAMDKSFHAYHQFLEKSNRLDTIR